jgi:hypothetical protein
MAVCVRGIMAMVVVVCVMGRGGGFRSVRARFLIAYIGHQHNTAQQRIESARLHQNKKAPTSGAMAAYTSPKGVSGARMLVWVRTLLHRAVSCHMDRVNTVVQSLATSVGHGGRMLHSAMSSDGMGDVGRACRREIRTGWDAMDGRDKRCKRKPAEMGRDHTTRSRMTLNGRNVWGGGYRNEGRNG